MKIITIQPTDFVDNIWAGPDGSIVEGKKLPYPFHVAEDGSVEDQDFWQGDPFAVLGFQNDVEVQRVDVWWHDVTINPQLAVGKYPVMSTKTGGMYTYTLAIESVQVFEVSA